MRDALRVLAPESGRDWGRIGALVCFRVFVRSEIGDRRSEIGDPRSEIRDRDDKSRTQFS